MPERVLFEISGAALFLGQMLSQAQRVLAKGKEEEKKEKAEIIAGLTKHLNLHDWQMIAQPRECCQLE